MRNTLALEQTLVNFIRLGDTKGLQEWMLTVPAIRGEILASDQLRQMKNTFIVAATLASRAAIRGSMDIDDAFSLSDSYIQKCELLSDYTSITNLQYHMIFDYTERVEKLRMGSAPSKLVMNVMNYIRHHLCEPVTTEEIAKVLFMSRSRLFEKVKQQTGENLVDFILKEKTEEAKRLFRYTDKSISAISAYLGFFLAEPLFTRFQKNTRSPFPTNTESATPTDKTNTLP